MTRPRALKPRRPRAPLPPGMIAPRKGATDGQRGDQRTKGRAKGRIQPLMPGAHPPKGHRLKSRTVAGVEVAAAHHARALYHGPCVAVTCGKFALMPAKVHAVLCKGHALWPWVFWVHRAAQLGGAGEDGFKIRLRIRKPQGPRQPPRPTPVVWRAQSVGQKRAVIHALHITARAGASKGACPFILPKIRIIPPAPGAGLKGVRPPPQPKGEVS